MKQNIKSIRPFIGSENFEISRSFYRDLGFEEVEIDSKMSLLRRNDTAFYLQDAYVKDWIDNTMVFMEVENTDEFFREVQSLHLTEKYENVKVSPVQTLPWGKECSCMIPVEFCGTSENFSNMVKVTGIINIY